MTWEFKELYDQQKEEARERKRDNAEWSTNHLTELGIAFTTNNNGVHLIVLGKVDFWPSTGKWIFRDGGMMGRGIKPLIRELTKRGLYEPTK